MIKALPKSRIRLFDSSCAIFYKDYKALKKTFSLLLILLVTIIQAVAQPNIYKTGGTSGSTFALGSTSSRKTQFIYNPSNFTNTSGLTIGEVDKLFFRYHALTGSTLSNFTVKVGETNVTSYSSGTFVPSSTLNTALSASSYTIPAGTAAGDWFEIPLTTPFIYDVSKSLVIELEFTASTSTAFTTRYTTLTNQKVYSATNGATTGTLNSNVQDLGMNLTPIASCSGTPTAGNAISSASTICAGSSFSLSLSGTSVASGLTYQWQKSTNGTSWSDITGETNNTLTTTQSASSYYRAVVSCGANAQPSGNVYVTTPIAFNGTLTVNQNLSASPPTNFTTIQSAIDYLTCGGINGNVNINVTASTGPYNEQVLIPAITGASASNQIIINGNNNKVSFAQATGSRYIFRLDGADYITIKNFDIETIGTTYGWGIHLYNSADYNTIQDNTITVQATSTSESNSVGIVLSNATSSVTTTGNNGSNNIISGNTIIGGYKGIHINGDVDVATPSAGQNQIFNNTIQDFHSAGIEINNALQSTISDNLISRPNRTSTGTFYGVYIAGGSLKTLVDKNKVYNSHAQLASSTGAAYGVYIISSDAPVGSENVVQNNIIYNLNNNGLTAGLADNGSDGAKFYHNTVYVNNPAATATATILYGFYGTLGVTDRVDVRNNIFYVTRGGTAKKYAIGFNAGSTNITSNGNIFYIDPTDAAAFIGILGGEASTIADWRTLSSQDAKSKMVDPAFTNPATADFTPGSATVDDNGVPVGVLTDFAGTSRSTSKPDPGAYEFTIVGKDAKITWVGPVAPISAGNQTITVKIENLISGTPITSLQLAYTDGITPVTQSFTGLNITTATQNFSFTTPYNLSNAVQLKAYIVAVNGSTDLDQTNDTTAVQNICVSLSGTYTINKNVAVSATNFTSFKTAAEALSNCGVSGPVIFNFTSSSSTTYNEQIVISTINGASATNTVTINGNGNTISFASTDANARAVIKLDDADYVKIDNLKIDASSGTYGWGIHLINSADNNTISNCTVTSSTNYVSNNHVGITASGSNTSIASGGINASNTTISNNTISGGQYGVVFSGNGAGSQGLNNKVLNNTISDFYTYGVYFDDQVNGLVSGNNIHRLNRTSASTFYGVSVLGSSSANLISKNQIHDPFSYTTTSTAYGLHISGADATAGNENKFVNNLIYNFKSNGTIYGLYNSNSDYVTYLHNTIVLDDATSTGSSATYGFYQTATATGIVIKNNIFTINRSSTGTKTALYSATNTSSITSNYNVFHLTSANVGYFSSTSYATLANWKTANSGAFDQNSLEEDPLYQNAASNNYKPTAVNINNKGQSGLGVTDDITGATRTGADPGAYDFTPPTLDAKIEWVSPTGPTNSGSNTVQVKITNMQATTITDVELSYTDGSITQTQTFIGLNIATSTNTLLSFTTPYNFTDCKKLYANIITVNGITDGNLLNNKDSVYICPRLAGTYTINSASATASRNFQSFTDAVYALKSYGISAAVTFNVNSTSGPYIEQISIPVIDGTSSSKTVTFNGNNRTIAFAAALSGQRSVIELDGADYVTIKNLTVNATGSTYGYGISLKNESDNNSILNNSINITSLSATEANSAGIVSSSSQTSITATGNNSNNLTITGNTITGGYTGIRLNGASATPSTNNTISGNNVQDFYSDGIYVNYVTNSIVEGNDISRPVQTATMTTFSGILIYNCTSVNVYKNKIHNPSGVNTGSHSFYGIYNSGDAPIGQEIKIYNNLMYNINAKSSVYGIYNTGADGVHYYHNTIVIDNPGISSTSLVRGFHQSTLASNIVFRNNVISITRGGTGTKHGLYFSTTTSSITSNNNVIYINASSAHVGYYSANRTTLADWKAVNSSAYDQNSVDTNPLFTNEASFNYKPQAFAMNNIGANVGITKDFANVTRGSNPDPGAYEFTPSCSLAGEWTGLISSDWTVASNWCGGVVPTSTTDVIIPKVSTNNPVLSTSQSVKSLTINTGGVLLATGGTLSVMGTLTNNGSMTATGGTVALSGTIAQSVTGSKTTAFYNLTVGPLGATLGGAASVQQLLTLNGNLNTSGNTFTLLSNASGTAMVVNSGGVVNGTATMQRYIDPSINGSAGYRHYSSPMVSTTISDLKASGFNPIVNPAYNTAVNPYVVKPFPNVYMFDESRIVATDTINDKFDYGWASPAALTEVMAPGKGYTVNVGAASKIDFRGTLNNGTVTVNGLSRGSNTESGWHLLGNPYPSPIDWDLLTRTNVGNALYMFRSSGKYAGAYTSYVNGIGPAGSDIIPAMQGFIVRASASGASLSFSNTARLTTYSNPTFYRSKQEERPLLELSVSGSNGKADAVYVYQQEGAAQQVDDAYDAYKVQTSASDRPAVYIQVGRAALSIKGIPHVNKPQVLDLAVNVPKAGTYTFAVEQLVNFPASASVQLEDRENGKRYELQELSQISLELSKAGNPGRFRLHINPQADRLNPELQAAVYPNPSHGSFEVLLSGIAATEASMMQVRIVNQLGQQVRGMQVAIENGSRNATVQVEGLAKGVYLLQVQTGSQVVTQKVVIE